MLTKVHVTNFKIYKSVLVYLQTVLVTTQLFGNMNLFMVMIKLSSKIGNSD